MDNSIHEIPYTEVQCACLAINRALIGISELYLAEQASKESTHGSFRIYKALQVYYIVYNICASYMVLYDHIGQKIKRSSHNKVELSELNSTDESSSTWNNQRKLEQDLVTMITHSHIKCFCDKLRCGSINIDDMHENAKALRVIFESFISEDSPYKYEKLCYIRDRAIYRPSFVICTDDSVVQTSLHVRSEIDSLPDSEQLYEILKAYFTSLISENEDVRMLYNIFFVKNKIEYWKDELLLSEENVKMLQSKKMMTEDYSVHSYFCQLLELEDINISMQLYEKFCQPIMQIVYS